MKSGGAMKSDGAMKSSGAMALPAPLVALPLP